MHTHHPHPPGSWRPARELARRALAPVERFLAIEAASGLVLFAAAAVALAWANSPWKDAYEALWHTPVGLRVGPLALERDLHGWIDDGLMTVFFFVVGLEIRRELHRGELSEPRRAALPVAAALGGMVAPALVFGGLNLGRPTVGGWGIPMATDIAFAVGVLTLLGSRVPPALRILLLALAVIDDLGAIVVIALFYSHGLEPAGFVVAAAGLGGILGLQWLGVRTPWAYVPPAVLAWAGADVAGIHPTLAGVAVGLMTPVKAWFGREGFVARVEEALLALRREGSDGHALHHHLAALDRARQEAVSPVERLEHALHGWVAFGVMPLFALANAGVTLGDASLAGSSGWVFAGVVAGLVLGKPVGIVAASWLAVRTGVAALPSGVTWPRVGLVGAVGGIGFTMAIFVASLAFPPGTHLETAKAAVLVGSGLAAALGYGLGRAILPAGAPVTGAATEAEAEASTTS